MQQFKLFFQIFALLATSIFAERSSDKINIGFWPITGDSDWSFGFMAKSPKINTYFKVKHFGNTSSTDYLREELDLTTLIDPISFNRWADSPEHLPRQYVMPSVDTLRVWNDKPRWKKWMQYIGLGDYIAQPIDPKHPYFPLVFKEANMKNYGAGVHVVNNNMELQVLVNQQKSRGESYLLEEALTGMGLSEGAAFGSAYDGELLMLRCMRMSFDGAKNKPMTKAGNGELYINGGSTGQIKGSSSFRMASCGLQLVYSVRKMAQLGKYSGAFCVNFKMDNRKNIKFLEVNARMCAGVSRIENLFISTYLPLAFAVQERIIRDAAAARRHYRIPEWYANSTIHRDVFEMERAVSMSGMTPFTTVKQVAFDSDPADAKAYWV